MNIVLYDSSKAIDKLDVVRSFMLLKEREGVVSERSAGRFFDVLNTVEATLAASDMLLEFEHDYRTVRAALLGDNYQGAYKHLQKMSKRQEEYDNTLYN